MSRLTSMSPEAIRQLFSPDADSTLITLVTFYDENNEVLARIADNYTKRISETDTEVIYGLTSNGDDYTFLPVQITLPSEEEANAPRCSIVIEDVTRYLTPIIRTLSKPPRVKLDIVLSKTPDDIEIQYDDFYVTNVTTNAQRVSFELSMISLQQEPFPMYSCTPQFNPGLF